MVQLFWTEGVEKRCCAGEGGTGATAKDYDHEQVSLLIIRGHKLICI